MKPKHIIAAVSATLTLPFLLYVLGNVYVFLFDGWKLNSDKMGVAVMGLLIGGFIAIMSYAFPD